MATIKATISRDAIFQAVKECYRESLEHGGGRWFYVTVWPDGEITKGMEASPCYNEREYYKQEPHPVTVWETRSNSDLDEEEIDAEMDAFDWEWFDLNVGNGNLDEALKPTGLTIV